MLARTAILAPLQESHLVLPRTWERDFEDGTMFVVNDDRIFAQGRMFQAFAFGDLQGPSRRFLGDLCKIGQVDAVVIEESRVTASDVEKVACHSQA
jgi:hypothetical protein